MAEDPATIMARRVKHHMSHIGKHPGGRAQAVSIAECECGVSKNAEHEKEACFESQVPVGSFTAMPEKIKIKGGDYKWVDTQDGYFTVLDVPLVSEWKKGDHDATYEGTKDVLEEFVGTAQRRYSEGKFCATAYKRHNPEIPIDHPDFLGYALPNRVGKYTLESGEKWTIFGDIKLAKEGFEQARAGKLPYISVEIPWSKRRIRGVSFQDTLPPHYEYALFTVGEQVSESTAKFEVAKDSVAKFMEDEKKPEEKKESGEAPHKEPDGDELDAKIEKGVAKHMAANGAKYFAQYAQSAKFQANVDPMNRKPTGMPAEPVKDEGGAKMTDPELAAKLTAMANDNAELKGKFAALENEKKAQALMAKAEEALVSKIVTPALREQLANFATEWAPSKDADERFGKYLEALKPSLKEKPVGVGTFARSGVEGTNVAADVKDPVIAKFYQEFPDRLDEIGKLSAQHRELKRMFGARIQSNEEDFIRTEMGIARAKRDGLFTENRG